MSTRPKLRRLGRSVSRAAARLATGSGVACLLFVGVAYLDRALASGAPDQSEWSERARAAYAAAIGGAPPPVARLSIERLGIDAPVFLGTDRVTLNRGAGVIDGTPRPGEPGNVAISAHRDGFFRPLKDIAVGDIVALERDAGTQRFEVREISIVDPLDVSVLEPTEESVLTLVTCYPFYYVGSAPDRFVVRAVLLPEPSHAPVVAQDGMPGAPPH